MKFSKKPDTIDAVQWLITNVPDIMVFLNTTELRAVFTPDGLLLVIQTLHGERRVRPGQWIVQDAEGSCFSCSGEWLHARYDAVKERSE